MKEGTTAPPATASPWPRRLAFSTLLAAVPLVFFGGTVTTLHAGLAIDGWLILEPGRGDHFLWLYPIDKWFRDVGTFVEHTHRLFGSLVGLLAIATIVATWATDRRRLPRILSLAAFLAVAVQGTIGGLRVLDQSENLAFLHGAIAQAVFALLGASFVAASAGAPSTRTKPWDGAARLRSLTVATSGVVYLQIVAGAWLRHGGSVPALAVHGVLAAAVVVLVWMLARDLRRSAEAVEESGKQKLLALRRWLLGLLASQIALGVAAFVVVWWLVGPDSKAATGIGTSLFPTLHVLAGGSLLLACVASSMWVRRLFRDAEARASVGALAPSPSAGIEVAR
jgi:cytochrome c oxidase assembly protein subunit 15